MFNSPVPTAFWDSFNMAAFEEEISDGICIDCHAHISAKEFQKVKASLIESILVKVENFNEKLRRFLLLFEGYRCSASSGQSGKFLIITKLLTGLLTGLTFISRFIVIFFKKLQKLMF